MYLQIFKDNTLINEIAIFNMNRYEIDQYKDELYDKNGDVQIIESDEPSEKSEKVEA